ncbi:hypothetical protein Tco_1216997 [Tanacetum coccineum]
MDLVTKLSDRVLVLETDLKETKKVYSTAFTKLIMKVKKLEKIVKSNKARRRAKFIVSDDEEDLEDSSKQGRRIADIDQHSDISLVHHDADIQGSAAVTTASEGSTVLVESHHTPSGAPTTSQPGVTIREPCTRQILLPQQQIEPKNKEEMQAELEEEARIEIIAQEEASIAALTVEFDAVQAIMDDDALLAAKLQEEEREQFSIDEQARFLVETIAERKRFFAAQRT